jgi:hypothetical protein
MSERVGRRMALPLLLGIVLLAAWVLSTFAPDPSADVAKGTEEAFTTGLYPRELEPGGVIRRWSGGRLVVSFRSLPDSTIDLEVSVRGHRSPVVVASGGVVLGSIPVGAVSAVYAAQARNRVVDLVLTAESFAAGDGRRLGFQLDRVTARFARGGSPLWPLALLLLAPVLATLGSALAVRLGLVPAALLAVAVGGVQCLLLWPSGLLHSPWATHLSFLLIMSAFLAATSGRWIAAGAGVSLKPLPGNTAAWAFVPLLLACLVQGILATHPCMVVSDAVFHANNLRKVAAGDWHLTSITPHVPPFRIPYGVSFYVLLLPWLRAGLDPVTLVRAGAAISSLLATVAVFRLLAGQCAARAGLAVIALQLLPISFDLFSYGNLSNVFGHAVTVAFFCWWAGGLPGGFVVGALLLVVGGLSHFGCLIVLSALVSGLLLARRDHSRENRPRVLAAALGFSLIALYYAQFLELVIPQVSRLMEGAGRGERPGLLEAGLRQVRIALRHWGAPAFFLALLGRPRRKTDELGRDLAVYWAVALVLGLLAVVSPLEVRYTYAFTLPLSVAAADGLLWLAGRGWGRVAVVVLGPWQVYLAVRGVAEDLLHRYRP